MRCGDTGLKLTCRENRREDPQPVEENHGKYRPEQVRPPLMLGEDLRALERCGVFLMDRGRLTNSLSRLDRSSGGNSTVCNDAEPVLVKWTWPGE